ncbi:MAG: FliO/MopB family protein [Alphaproteobacteria bacterium]
MELIGFQQILQLIMALALVIGLMSGLALVMKRLGLGHATPVNKSAKRLKIIESLPLDGRRRLILIECDRKQHLVILGLNGETIVTTDIEPPAIAENYSEETAAKI